MARATAFAVSRYVEVGTSKPFRKEAGQRRCNGKQPKAAPENVGRTTLQIIRRSVAAKSFDLPPRCRVVERSIESSTAQLFSASVQLFARRIASH